MQEIKPHLGYASFVLRLIAFSSAGVWDELWFDAVMMCLLFINNKSGP